jgi:hypothetical protein
MRYRTILGNIVVAFVVGALCATTILNNNAVRRSATGFDGVESAGTLSRCLANVGGIVRYL